MDLNPNVKIVLTSDASDFAIAHVLSHKFNNKVSKPIAFVSRALSRAEQKYSTHEKEALAIIFLIIGNDFKLKTDQKPLISIFGENMGLPLMAAARIQRWAFILSGFNYRIEYVKVYLNEADGLSRIPQHKGRNNLIENGNGNTYVNYILEENFLYLDFRDIAKATTRDPIQDK